jgi:hypothetical protein
MGVAGGDFGSWVRTKNIGLERLANRLPTVELTAVYRLK